MKPIKNLILEIMLHKLQQKLRKEASSSNNKKFKFFYNKLGKKQ